MEEERRVDWKEGAKWRGHFYTYGEGGGWWGRQGGWTGQRGGAMGRGDFTDGMPGWRYFSRAMPDHPASITLHLASVHLYIYM